MAWTGSEITKLEVELRQPPFSRRVPFMDEFSMLLNEEKVIHELRVRFPDNVWYDIALKFNRERLREYDDLLMNKLKEIKI